jgi:hypothetical protein
MSHYLKNKRLWFGNVARDNLRLRALVPFLAIYKARVTTTTLDRGVLK